MKYATIFHLLSEEFSKKHIRCVVIGGFAVNYHGVTRQTVDSDFMLVDSDYDLAKELLQKHGYKEADVRHAFARLKGPNAFLLDVDFMFVDRSTFDQIWAEGVDAKVADCEFRLPSLDHLMALKFHAMKHNPGRHNQKDLLDLAEGNDIDVASEDFKALCLKFGSAQVYNDVLKARPRD